MIIQEKCFSCYALLTDQFSLPECLYFLRYWLIYVLQPGVCLLIRLQRHKFLNQLYLSNQSIFPHDQKFKKNK